MMNDPYASLGVSNADTPSKEQDNTLAGLQRLKRFSFTIKPIVPLAAGLFVGLVADRYRTGRMTAGRLRIDERSLPIALLSRQTGTDDCGPAVLVFILTELGRFPPTHRELQDVGGHLPWSLADLARTADDFGLRVELLQLDTITRPGWHVMHLQTDAGGHFVAARRVGTEPTILQVFDPASGTVRLIHDDVLQPLWTGAVLWIEGERFPP